eukprot:11190193-Lingulodinium_polyedra.AAC.1
MLVQVDAVDRVGLRKTQGQCTFTDRTNSIERIVKLATYAPRRQQDPNSVIKFFSVQNAKPST